VPEPGISVPEPGISVPEPGISGRSTVPVWTWQTTTLSDDAQITSTLASTSRKPSV
jgi:hypothetical protein